VEDASRELARVREIETRLQASGAPGAPDSAERHLWLAGRLEEQGETLAARGHRLRARLRGAGA
jgi:hypothetical protein